MDCSTGIETDYGLDGRGSIPAEAKFFSSLQNPDRLWGPTKPTIRWVPWALSPGINCPGREVDLSPIYSAEVKNDGAIPSLPHTSS
jgi:hypothetical protein